jgi:antitoxin component HigA of HigAB toxin-antitoxin module
MTGIVLHRGQHLERKGVLMMHFKEIKKAAHYLLKEASYIWKIKSSIEHEQALKLIDSLLDCYEVNELLIDLLSHAIEEWEEHAEDFVDFNRQVDQLTLNQAKEDNPDLTEDFIMDALIAANEKKYGQLEEYSFSNIKNRINTLQKLSELDQELHLGYEVITDKENGKLQHLHDQIQSRLSDINDRLKVRRSRKIRRQRVRKL